MRMFWLLALGLIVTQGIHAQNLSGTVVDARTGEPLPLANVLLTPGDIGTASDQSGVFSFHGLPARTYTLRVSFVGYEPFEEPVHVGRGEARRVIALRQAPMPGPEIEVSAIRAVERVSPVTFSNINLQTLKESYFVQDVPVLLADLPSAVFYSESGNGIGYNYLRIRGFDQRRLAVMVNGVPQNDPEDHNVYWLDFSDLLGSAEDIQVQRGAGSAFYGPPAIGGSINIVTGDFANQRGVRISTGFGGYLVDPGAPALPNATRRYAVSFGSGLIDKQYTLFGRISKTLSDGYRDHSWMNANAYYFSATRYDERLTTRLNVYGGPVADGLVYEGLPRFAITNTAERRKNFNYWEQNAAGTAYTYTQNRRPQEVEEFSQPHVEVLNEWKASERLTFNNVLFYVMGQGYFDYDGTGWTNAAYYRLTDAFGFPNAADPVNPLIHAYVDNRQVGWLPRMTLAHDGGTLTAGFELRRHRSLHWGKIRWAERLPGNLDPDRRYYEYRGAKDIASVYAHELLTLSPRLTLMADLQYVYNRYALYDEKYVGTDFSVGYHFFNPRVGVNFNLDESTNLYGNMSWTQREPRLKNLYDAAESSGGATPQFEQRPDRSYDFSAPLVKPEKLLNVEAGLGHVAERTRVYFNGFLMRFADEIIKNGDIDKFGQPVTGNADRTLHLGMELSASYSPFAYFELNMNAMLSRSRLQRYSTWVTNATTNATVDSSLDGNRIAGFPEQLLNVSATWRQAGFTASLSVKYVGDQYTDNFQREDHRVDPYTVLNATLGYRTPPFFGMRGVDLRAQVNNLTNNLFAQSGEGDRFFVAAERNYFFDIAIDF
jgi:iron complex outermembrane recepter protein